MAQVVRHDKAEFESLLSQAKEKALLQKAPCCVKKRHAFVRHDQLMYEERQSWEFHPDNAELIGGRVLNVGGVYPTQLLEEGLTYVVSFEVLLKENFNIKTPVRLTLTLPDGSTQQHFYNLMVYPRNVKILLKAGEFVNDNPGLIEFTLEGTERETWKQGLVIYGVHISAVEPVTK